MSCEKIFAPVFKLPQKTSFRKERLIRMLQEASQKFFFYEVVIQEDEFLLIHIPHVELASDLSLATVYVEFNHKDGTHVRSEDYKSYLKAIQFYQKPLRKHWSDTVALRRTPQIKFKLFEGEKITAS
jgi:ribosome-binding factor A